MFEVYKPLYAKENTVTISKNNLTLNKKFVDKFESEYVELAFDKDTQTIRIMASDNQNGLMLNENKIGASGFFKHFNIQHRGKYNAIYIDNENALYVKC